MAEVSIGRAFTRLAAIAPDAVAVRVPEGPVLTRAELDDAAGRLAARWMREGLVRDDVVVVSLLNGVDAVLAAVAAWKAGATVQPHRPGTPMPGRPALVVDAPPRVPATGTDPSVLDPDLVASSWKVSATSGSTGTPRLVPAGAPARIDPDRCTPEFMPAAGVQLVAGPLGHTAPFVYAMRGLMSGHELVVLPRFEPECWLAAAADHGVTWAMVVPAMMAAIRRVLPEPPPSLPALERVLHLGARCPHPVKRAWIDWLGPDRVWELYAGTESHGLALVGGSEWLEHPGTVGRPIAGSSFRIERDDGSEADVGEVGLVTMRRDDGPWRTQGDLGRLDSEGRLYLADRAADVVRLDGRVVWPADVEAEFEAHPLVRAAAVVARDGVLVAVVETDLAAAELETFRRRLPAELRPDLVEVTAEPVRDEMGKVRRSRWR